MRPRAFQIRDFKSIVDSGVCVLSGDNITVLAGQNEAGKTAVLSALRDFDLEEGTAPRTQDYRPDGHFDANPRVSVQFVINSDELVAALTEDNKAVPERVVAHLKANPTLWVTRYLAAGKYQLDAEVRALWEAPKKDASQGQSVRREPTGSASEDEDAEDADDDDAEEAGAEEVVAFLEAEDFADWLRNQWPSFVYFDSFTDSLPREVDFSDLRPPKKTPPAPIPAASAGSRSAAPKVASSVLDFVTMADLDLELVETLAEQDKTLGNYLSSRSAAVTGDFLTYWKQKLDAQETVNLHVRHQRDSEGTLKLAFYVHDKIDQYPDQRSKGFLWFLSFYLKLAAARRKYPERKRLLLIDEPGSYLHARAQKDVLHLFEDRIVPDDLVIYSTHSPYLMPPDRLHRLRIVLKSTDSGTKVLDRLTHPALRGGDFADSLSPVITAIGIDITESLNFSREKNLFVEGISDLMYLSSWAKSFKPEINDKFNIFPGTGATTIPLLGSLFIGWGLHFVVLLDNDDQGRPIREKLVRDLLISPSRIVHPKDAKTIEDLFSVEDFRSLLGEMDSTLTLNQGESPSSAIKRQNIDKVLLARTYSERAVQGKLRLTKKSQEAISRTLTDIWDAWKI
jgi:predicted ATP-dependent endonuclease of OLD family